MAVVPTWTRPTTASPAEARELSAVQQFFYTDGDGGESAEGSNGDEDGEGIDGSDGDHGDEAAGDASHELGDDDDDEE